MIITPPPTILLPGEVDLNQRFLTAAHDRLNVFLSGMAGTGKSTLLRQFIRETKDREIDITAPTGIAALNVGGSTIHRWCGMLIGPGSEGHDPNETNEEFYDWLRTQPARSIRNGWDRVRMCQCLVIDEISMMAGRQLDYVEWLFRRVRNDDRPWGGCQIIVVGDFCQLAPVQTDKTKDYDWAFKTKAWADSQFTNIILDRIYRQTEVNLISALCAVRIGEVAGRAAAILNSRQQDNPPASIPHLCTHNRDVDKVNAAALAGLTTPEVRYEGIKTGNESIAESLVKSVTCPEILCLKIGAWVMLTVNDRNNRFVNGTVGRVTELRPDKIAVKTLTSEFDVARFTWKSGNDFDRYYADFTQFPIRLAYAMTIHKCQGITLDSAYIDVRAAREPGQAYVALSRVKTLAGLWLKEQISGVVTAKAVGEFYAEISNAPPF